MRGLLLQISSELCYYGDEFVLNCSPLEVSLARTKSAIYCGAGGLNLVVPWPPRWSVEAYRPVSERSLNV